MNSLLGLAVGAFLSIAATSAAPPLPATPLTPAGAWKVDYSDLSCTLQRPMASAGDPYVLSLAVTPLESRITLTIMHAEPVNRRDSGDATIYVDGAAQPTTAHFNFYNLSGQLAVRQYLLDYGEHGLGKVRDRLRLKTRSRGDFDLHLPRFQSALQELAACKLDLHRSLGIDDAVVKAMVVKPRGFPLSYVDMPAFSNALNFTLVYWVKADGRIEQCRLLAPSGMASFDKRICPMLEKKGRMTPGKDAAGRPIRAPVYLNMRLRKAIGFDG